MTNIHYFAIYPLTPDSDQYIHDIIISAKSLLAANTCANFVLFGIIFVHFNFDVSLHFMQYILQIATEE